MNARPDTTDSAIFLSAGIPNKNLEHWQPDVLAIREAVLALVAVASPTRELVFGGHPAISPLVEHAARSLGTVHHIFIYQSRFFEKIIPPEAMRFENFEFTPRLEDIPQSLLLMRQTMLNSRQFRAGVFIGGMDGILDECTLFKKRWSNAQVFPIASTGGAARVLFRDKEGPLDEEVRTLLSESRRYRDLFRRVLRIDA